MKNSEELLIRIIHFMAEKFKAGILLEGGMFLRLLNCPRATQDVDYVLISSESKKEIAGRIKKMLSGLPDIRVEAVNLNSRGVFIDVTAADNPSVRGKIEITVQASMNLPSESISTAIVARTHSLAGRIVATIALSEAFSNKIAAALERDTARDLYDLSQFEPLCAFDIQTLRGRFSSLSIKRGKPVLISFTEAASMFKERAGKLTENILEKELYPLLSKEYRGGLLPIIKACMIRIASKLENEARIQLAKH